MPCPLIRTCAAAIVLSKCQASQRTAAIGTVLHARLRQPVCSPQKSSSMYPLTWQARCMQGQKMAQDLAAKNTAAAESRKKAYQRSLQQEIQAAPKRTFAQRIQKWRETGIVSLRGLELTSLPTGLDDLGPSIYAVDVGDNDLTALPGGFPITVPNHCSAAAPADGGQITALAVAG